VTNRRAPQDRYCFRIDHRDEEVTGNIKHVWEPSRFQHVTVLAAAFALTREPVYAERAASHLRSWWAQNPFLSGVHWTSGIEVGLRLISWVWTRRLLEGWEVAPSLFEDNVDALNQIWWHQRYLARFRSRGSSANNHVIAEAAGQLVAALGFDWFEESERWAAAAAHLLGEELTNNTFASGVNREMAFDYHGFVAELGIVAAAEADRAGRPVSERTWKTLCRMVDVVASVADAKLGAPRQGDSDDGRVLLLGPPEQSRWSTLLAVGRTVFGPLEWWPRTTPDMMSILLGSMADVHPDKGRPELRSGHFADAGLTVLRSAPSHGPEIWCRCDGGPHGFLSIAAHAHADALAIEVRYDGTEVLTDPGTYCYGGQSRWRDYFRSTLAHNTVEIGGQNQSTSGGPTLWTRHAHSEVIQVKSDADGRVNSWSALHDGYAELDPPVRHRRTVRLSSETRRIDISDEFETSGRHPIRLAFHLGPNVEAEISGRAVELTWEDRAGTAAKATLLLPEGLDASLVRGSVEPVLGWYSRGFGVKEPSNTALATGYCTGSKVLQSSLLFWP
jgi:hypothetical protein